MTDSEQTYSELELGLMVKCARLDLALRGIIEDYETSSRGRELAQLALGEHETQVAKGSSS